VGQRIYTPRTNSVAVVEHERPHAGWLYGAATAIAQRAADRHTLRLEVGITGPPSLAEFMQVNVHRLGGYWMPRGWRNQLNFEPGLLVGYGYERVLAAPTAGSVRIAELSSEVAASVGTVITGGSAGLNGRLGLNVPHSWRMEHRVPGPELAAYLTGGVRVEGYLRNLFLDGNTFHDGHQVDKRPVVGRYRFGAAVRVDEIELNFEVVTRTREYHTEPDGHRYSSIGLTYRP
jgi:lipid A 3-O-deacylase